MDANVRIVERQKSRVAEWDSKTYEKLFSNQKVSWLFLEYDNRLGFLKTQEIEKDEERDSNKFFGSGRFYG